MSAFPGRTREYRLISLDRFDGDNLRSTAFVLSHAHSDHMRGLDSATFRSRLRSDNRIKLYCSEITKKLLLVDSRFYWLEKQVVALPYDVPTEIAIPDPYNSLPTTSRVVLTLTPCGHCIGAAMVLLEGDCGTVLYTGDFRLDIGSAARLSSLHTPSGTVKEVKSMYCDTTFFAPQSNQICSRDESEAEIIRLVGDHLRKSESHVVLLQCKAKIGYENVYVEIYKRLGTKVHVAPADMAFYRELSDVGQCVTSDGTAARVHACSRRIQVLHSTDVEDAARAKSDNGGVQLTHPTAARCPVIRSCFDSHRHVGASADSSKLLVIQLSTMWFVPGQVAGGEEADGRSSVATAAAQPHAVTTWLSPCYARVCYSFHSSASEVADFVCYVQPRQAFANVCPIGHTLEETNVRLAELLHSRAGRGAPAAEQLRWWQALPEVVIPKRRFLDNFDVRGGCGTIASAQLSQDSERRTNRSSQSLPSDSPATDQRSSQSTLLTSTPEIDLWSSSADSAEDDDGASQDAVRATPNAGRGALLAGQFIFAGAGHRQTSTAASCHLDLPDADDRHLFDCDDISGRGRKQLKPFVELDLTVDRDQRRSEDQPDGNRTPTASDDEPDCVPPSPEAKVLRAVPSFRLLRSCLPRP